MRNSRSPTLPFLAGLLGLALVAGPGVVRAQSHDIAPSADTSSIFRRHTGIDDSGDYRRELQACLSGRTQQAQETCLKETRNARAALARGELATAGENYTANALARCEPLMGEYRIACEARVMGFGSASGNVAGGGILREVETVVVPPGANRFRVDAKTSNPVLVAPAM